jgi:hypothetical protein
VRAAASRAALLTFASRWYRTAHTKSTNDRTCTTFIRRRRRKKKIKEREYHSVQGGWGGGTAHAFDEDGEGMEEFAEHDAVLSQQVERVVGTVFRLLGAEER